MDGSLVLNPEYTGTGVMTEAAEALQTIGGTRSLSGYHWATALRGRSSIENQWSRLMPPYGRPTPHDPTSSAPLLLYVQQTTFTTTSSIGITKNLLWGTPAGSLIKTRRDGVSSLNGVRSRKQRDWCN